jgi:hypothetical protein
MIAPPEAGLGRRRGWALPHFGTKAEERQSIEREIRGQSWFQASVAVGVGSALSGQVKRWHARSTPGAAAVAISFLRSDDTVETKRAVHRFSTIRMRSLNDPRQGSLPTVQTVTTLGTHPVKAGLPAGLVWVPTETRRTASGLRHPQVGDLRL